MRGFKDSEEILLEDEDHLSMLCISADKHIRFVDHYARYIREGPGRIAFAIAGNKNSVNLYVPERFRGAGDDVLIELMYHAIERIYSSDVPMYGDKTIAFLRTKESRMAERDRYKYIFNDISGLRCGKIRGGVLRKYFKGDAEAEQMAVVPHDLPSNIAYDIDLYSWSVTINQDLLTRDISPDVREYVVLRAMCELESSSFEIDPYKKNKKKSAGMRILLDSKMNKWKKYEVDCRKKGWQFRTPIAYV